MRRHIVLGPHTRTLGYAEAVLFIDDGKAEVVELYSVFEYGVCAYKDV